MKVFVGIVLTVLAIFSSGRNALAQTIPKCVAQGTSIGIEFVNLPHTRVTDGTDFLLRIKVGDPRRRLSVVKVLANTTTGAKIESKELATLANPTNSGEYNIPLTVTFAESDSSHLSLTPDTRYTLTAFGYDDGPAARQSCGHAEYGIRTGRQATFAVVMGFNYLQKDYKLQWAQKDAEDVVKHLIEQLHVDPANIWLFTDDVHAKDVVGDHVKLVYPKSPGELYDVLTTIADDIDGNSPFFFFFSGHQFAPTEEQRQRGTFTDSRYLMLPDSSTSKVESMIPRQALEVALANNTEPSVVIFDACFSGDTTATYLISHTSPFAKVIGTRVTGVIADQYSILKSQARLLSSPGNGESYEFPSVSNGVFTHFLINAVKDPDIFPSSQRILTISKAYKYAQDHMQYCSDARYINHKDKCDVQDMMTGGFKQKPDGNFPGITPELPWARRDSIAP